MIIKNYLLFCITLIAISMVSVSGYDNKRLNSYNKTTCMNDKNNYQASLLTIKIIFDGLLSNQFILRGFHLVKKGQRVPKMNLFISEAFAPGRELGVSFDKPYIFTDMLYSQKNDALREGSIKILLEARDFSFGFAGYRLGKLLKKQTSMLPALKFLGVGISLEHILEEGYINHLFPTDQRLLKNQRIKEAKENNTSNTINTIVNNRRVNAPHEGVENISFNHFSKTNNKNIKEYTKLYPSF